MGPIVKLQLEDVRKPLADRHVSLDVTPAALEHLSMRQLRPGVRRPPVEALDPA